ncbi:hypothetical protein M409DRAFT_61408 [Zasmidium cellare ATCC 36951]|uniref:JmjC domain-containing protein n=1 Tax=Zasmidium cellare ATCC 36951 TaxID=1080233 RepID=A0A6A6BXU6_ZASCE|nr:uncharacterized protein M409DRAFT_61408 [Zasmidium cellare ATCC 36951]KAF2158750.1 hypothetical protein M409DRAFT_61408 [Zasmidium cellare ATCC 36951]
MRLLRKCARACPDFAEDFLPSANTVLVARQRASLQNSKVKTIKETRACNTNTRWPSGKPSPASRCSLTFQDLHHVSDLVEKGEVEMYGEQLSRSSVDLVDLDLWVTSEDGEIPIGEDATLCSLRPQHYRQYLLQPDNFGLLQDRKDAEDVMPKKKASVISKKKVSVISKKASSVDKSYWQATKNLSRTGQPSKGTVRSSTRRKALTPDTRAADQDLEADPVIDTTASHSHITRQSSISTLTPLTSAESSPETSSAKSLRVLDPFQVHQGALSIEESLHNKHHEEIQLYAAKLQDESDQSDMHSVRAAWLTQATRWASIWTPPECGLGFGFALAEESADVHYCTSEYFLQAGRQGDVFTKPIVIKEAFSDGGMNTVHNFRSLLRDAFHNKALDIRPLGAKQTESVSTLDFLTRLDHGSGDNALNLRDLAKAQRPAFTMMPRFRLLETLAESCYGEPGKEVCSRPVDVASCGSFNILGQRGAFSGAHVDSLAGTWVRNLDGLKYWMIVPSSDMGSEVSAFCEQGDRWLPHGKERLILLEQDDVLLMPPGPPQVHAAHSPRTCLMSGGMLWDELNILSILHSLVWIGQNQQATNESVAYQLPGIINALQNLVQSDSARFSSHYPPGTFQRKFEDALQTYKALGCSCATNETEICPCDAAGRRCTAQCAGHPKLPESSQFDCMYEQAEEDASRSQRRGACRRA